MTHLAGINNLVQECKMEGFCWMEDKTPNTNFTQESLAPFGTYWIVGTLALTREEREGNSEAIGEGGISPGATATSYITGVNESARILSMEDVEGPTEGENQVEDSYRPLLLQSIQKVLASGDLGHVKVRITGECEIDIEDISSEFRHRPETLR